MSAYYNENDPFAAAWLVELMKDGLIADGWVDTRSIEDVKPNELKGFTQCHFFAGIGVWSLALRVAGWPDDRPVWTGSCPCQPFSAAGEGRGFADERHLWPAWFHLISLCTPAIVLGEQVASKDGLGWLDLVSSDLEGKGYACGPTRTYAGAFQEVNERPRLYFAGLADTDSTRQQGQWCDSSVAHETKKRQWSRADRYSAACGVGTLDFSGDDGRAIRGVLDHYILSNGSMYPIQPDILPLADVGEFRNRVAMLRGAGNALNLAQAACFVEAVMEYLDQ